MRNSHPAAGIRRHRRIRRRRGAALALVGLLALLVIGLIVVAFQSMVYLGSSQEVKNSVDAGALNVAKQAMQLKFDPTRLGYDDVEDATHMMGLGNFNRAVGKAYLVNANVQDMVATGYGTQSTTQSGDAAYQNLVLLGNELYSALKRKDFADLSFDQMAGDKPAKLLAGGNNVMHSQDAQVQSACLYRGEESNLLVSDMAALPASVGKPKLMQRNQSVFMQGYNASQANGKWFNLTSFHQDEAPHLISMNDFTKWQNVGVPYASNPLPNAFLSAGQLQGAKIGIGASACAVSNPMRTYQMTIPHAYVTIRIQNNAIWKVQGRQVYTNTYANQPQKYWGAKSVKIIPPGQGMLNGYATLGAEYKGDARSAIEALPGNHEPVYQKLLQRIKEVWPGYTEQQLKDKLSSIPVMQNGTSISTIILYPNYRTADNTDPILAFNTSDSESSEGHALSTTSGGLPSWLVPTNAEGSSKTLVTESAVVNAPNTCWSMISGPYPTDAHATIESGVISWAPGTGWHQNLGDIYIVRTTIVNFTGLPPGNPGG